MLAGYSRLAGTGGAGIMLQEKTFAASAANLNYLDYGPSSAAPLVMLHGGAWRWQEYLSLIPSLGQRWHIYALDLRGNGRSGWVPNKYRLQDFAEDNSEFVRRLKAPVSAFCRTMLCGFRNPLLGFR